MRIVNTYITLTMMLLCTLSVSGQISQQPYTNNWYVGNTSPGEWIQFKKVWLSEGNYRFTTQAVASAEGKTVHLEINNEILQENVTVPSNPGNAFGKIHLGHKSLQEGYYDIKLVFETGDVNCDMIFIRKSESLSHTVLDDDTKYELNFTDGMHTFATGGHANNCTRELLNGTDYGTDPVWKDPDGNNFSRKQVLSWNKQCMYNYNLPYTQETTDIYIQEQAEAKVEVVFAHGRGEPDNLSTVQITDRTYKTGPGGMPCAALKFLVDGIQRNPYARGQMKVAYFIDNAAFHVAIKKYLSEDLVWGNREHQEFVWNYAIKKFYQTVPREMLFFTQDGKVPMQWWSANSHLTYPDCGYQLKEFFEFIALKMKEEFDLDVALILGTTFFVRDPRLNDYAWGIQSWYSWRNDVRTEIREFNGKKFAFAFNGGRMPMQDCFLNDWDPETNQGTWRKDDVHITSNDSDGTPRIRQVYVDGHAQQAEWIVHEGWGDWREGSTWYRSHHSEYAFPNQYIALVREFADRNSGSILLEAEGCDEYYTTKPGNLGGAYRLNWYNDLDKEFWDANLEADISIFRPLHHLSEIKKHGTSSDKPFTKIVTGWQDVWAIGDGKDIFCNEVDGYPVVAWRRALKRLLAKDLAMGGRTVWAIDAQGTLMQADLSNHQDCHTSSGWYNKQTGIKIVDIDASQVMLWGVDQNNRVYYRDFAGLRDWTQVHGELTSITADESFIWGFTPSGDIVRMSTQNRSEWKKVDNPHKLIKLSAGNYEVWGINAQNKVYRMSSSGLGEWQYVNEGFMEVGVGVDYVWLLDTKGVPYQYEMSGFQDISVFNKTGSTAIPDNKFYGNSVIVKENPFRENLNIEISSGDQDEVTVMIFGLDGRCYKAEKLTIQAGINPVRLDGISHLTKGMYILTVTGNTQNSKTKIIKY